MSGIKVKQKTQRLFDEFSYSIYIYIFIMYIYNVIYIYIHQKGQRLPKSFNNKTYLVSIQQ